MTRDRDATKVNPMAADSLHHLAELEQIHIGFRRKDGSTGSTAVWIVGVGDDVFVRSMNGPTGLWYRRLRRDPDGEVADNGHHHRVHAEVVTDPDTIAAVTRAYEAKYAKSPYLPPFLNDQTAGTTLRLEPR